MEKTGNVNHNHCVKADPQDPLPFCYTTDPNVRYEHCDCDDNQMGFNYPDYNYQTVYNGKSNGYGGGANSGNGSEQSTICLKRVEKCINFSCKPQEQCVLGNGSDNCQCERYTLTPHIPANSTVCMPFFNRTASSFR